MASLEACRDLKSFHIEDKDDVIKERDQLKLQLETFKRANLQYQTSLVEAEKVITNLIEKWDKQTNRPKVAIIFISALMNAREYLAKRGENGKM